MAPPPVRITEITAQETHGLRRLVLRENRADPVVAFPEDEIGGAFHLGAFDPDGALIAVATFFPQGTERRPGLRAHRLRGMAVHPEAQGRGVGRELLRVAVEAVRLDGSEVLWAHGRDTALGFYTGLGWVVEGDVFIEHDLPHHDVILDLA